jgi:hypothetical protein
LYPSAQNVGTYGGTPRKRELVMPFQKAFPGRLSAINMTTESPSREIRGLDSSGSRSNMRIVSQFAR